jgi:hypothetical protein
LGSNVSISWGWEIEQRNYTLDDLVANDTEVDSLWATIRSRKPYGLKGIEFGKPVAAKLLRQRISAPSECRSEEGIIEPLSCFGKSEL